MPWVFRRAADIGARRSGSASIRRAALIVCSASSDPSSFTLVMANEETNVYWAHFTTSRPRTWNEERREAMTCWLRLSPTLKRGPGSSPQIADEVRLNANSNAGARRLDMRQFSRSPFSGGTPPGQERLNGSHSPLPRWRNQADSTKSWPATERQVRPLLFLGGFPRHL